MQVHIHPAANIVPLLEGLAFEALKADIRENGLHMPIAVWEGQILDGRNRMRACEELGIRPNVLEIKSLPGDSPTLYVLSANLHRRHLSPSQLAMVGARARARFDAEAKLRQARKTGTNEVCGDARDLAGQAVGVSGKTIDYASKVLKAGVPELVAACDAGKLAVSRAAQLVELAPDKQLKAFASGKLTGHALANASGPTSRHSRGVGFDQLVVRAREVQQLLGSLGSARAMVEAGHFDRAVVLNAVRQLEAVASAIQTWTQAAREQLDVAATPARRTKEHSSALHG